MRALLAFIVSIIVLSPFGMADAPEAFSYHLDLGPDSWAAVRVNVTAGTDLQLGSRSKFCTGAGDDFQSVVAGAAWVIYDQRPEIWAIATGMSFPGFGGYDEPAQYSDIARIRIAGQEFSTPANNDERCSGWFDGSLCGCIFQGNESVVIVHAAMGQRTAFDFVGQWTHGVISHDVVWGPLFAGQEGRAPGGVDASVYAPAAPTLWITGAGQHLMTTHGDTLGYFTPENRFTFGRTVWSCTQNAAPCDLTSKFESVYDLKSTTPTDWNFRIDASARISNSPGYYLAMVEFPDDTWID